MKGRLLAIEVQNFKCYRERARLDLDPLTVIIGRNNSGKSTLIQALLLLRQTLRNPRAEVPLLFSGDVQATGLRELTWGWPPRPEGGREVKGPNISVEWRCDVDIPASTESWVNAQRGVVAERAGVPWLARPSVAGVKTLDCQLELESRESEGQTIIKRVHLRLLRDPSRARAVFTRRGDGSFGFRWGVHSGSRVVVEMDHFLPYLDLPRTRLGRNDYTRAYVNAFQSCFAGPLQSLKRILRETQYLSSTRQAPPMMYPPVTTAPESVGAGGEQAAEMLWARKGDAVHYPASLDADRVAEGALPEIRRAPLVQAVNEVLRSIDIDGEVSVEKVQELGFRLLIGQASLQHVGRGLTYLLPLVEVGLLADPLRFTEGDPPASLQAYLDALDSIGHVVLEEPEAHVHPKAQSLLAHWFVSQAMAGRQLVVETHSDHIVRRLRGLAARARSDSPLERWLLDNVGIVEVSQEASRSTLDRSQLTTDGSMVQHWPADFMDEAAEEDSAIYYAALDKQETRTTQARVVHDEGPEPDPGSRTDG